MPSPCRSSTTRAGSRLAVIACLLVIYCVEATSLTPLDALRLSYAEAQLEMHEDAVAAVQPKRRLTQYLTSSSQSQEDLTVSQAQHNYCGKSPPPERLVIVAAARYNLDFLDRMGLPYVAYQHLDPEEPFYYNNAGNEAGAYLQFLIDHYDCLPKAMCFIHGHENETWHSASMQDILPRLKWNESTFADINRKMDTWVIPLRDISSDPFGPILANGTDAYNGSFNSHQIHHGRAYSAFEMGLWLQWVSMGRAYDKFFGLHGFGPMPGQIRYVCCAQFIVGAPRVRTRSKRFYEAAKAYLLDNDIRGNHIQTRKYIVGDLFTLYWGMMFGDGPEYQVKDECEVFTCPEKASRAEAHVTSLHKHH